MLFGPLLTVRGCIAGVYSTIGLLVSMLLEIGGGVRHWLGATLAFVPFSILIPYIMVLGECFALGKCAMYQRLYISSENTSCCAQILELPSLNQRDVGLKK